MLDTKIRITMLALSLIGLHQIEENSVTKLVIAALLALCLSCKDASQPVTSSPQAASYAAQKKGTHSETHLPARFVVYAWNNRADVYDLVNREGNVRSKSRLDRPTEFGGALDFCNTEILFCMRSYLEIVVPRNFPFPRLWSAAGYECRQLNIPTEASDVVKAECRLRENWTTTFEYSPTRGVLRYRRICPGCDGGSYELLSERGLFPAS
jgi:hypothetical protein